MHLDLYIGCVFGPPISANHGLGVQGSLTRHCSLCRHWGCLLFLHYVTGPWFFKTWGNSQTVHWCLVVRPEIIYLETSRRLTSWFSCCCPLRCLLLDIIYIRIQLCLLVKPCMCCFASHRCLYKKSNHPFWVGFPMHSMYIYIYIRTICSCFRCRTSDMLATVV